jgi:hypothetical protein
MLFSPSFKSICDMHEDQPFTWNLPSLKGDFFGLFLLIYDIQHCFICRLSDSTVSEDAGIEPRTVATMALVVRRSDH